MRILSVIPPLVLAGASAVAIAAAPLAEAATTLPDHVFVGTTKVRVVAVTPVTVAGVPARNTWFAPGDDVSNPSPVSVTLSPGAPAVVSAAASDDASPGHRLVPD